jgi:hypothetical protein
MQERNYLLKGSMQKQRQFSLNFFVRNRRILKNPKFGMPWELFISNRNIGAMH